MMTTTVWDFTGVTFNDVLGHECSFEPINCIECLETDFTKYPTSGHKCADCRLEAETALIDDVMVEYLCAKHALMAIANGVDVVGTIKIGGSDEE